MFFNHEGHENREAHETKEGSRDLRCLRVFVVR
jgi:hypothetical protein